MYYLLADNRIIDSRKVKVFVKSSSTKFNYLHRNNKNKYCIGIIEKSSENVYDLIDWKNDLVRVDWSCGKNFILDCNMNKSDFLDDYYSLDWITAIYKLDAKGNYIKVWEKKEDE